MRTSSLTWLLLTMVFVCGNHCSSNDQTTAAESEPQPISRPSLPPTPSTAPFPSMPFPDLHVLQSVVSTARTIVASTQNEKVEISDSYGKNITLKRTRFLGGKAELTEYKAEDLTALKRKSPEAALLYEKLTQVPGAPIPQPPTPVVNTRIHAFQSDESESESRVSIGLRKIRVELEDRKIEIFDSADESILLKIIRTEGGQNQVDEFTADNLWQFKNLHPEAYQIYKKYSGVSFD